MFASWAFSEATSPWTPEAIPPERFVASPAISRAPALYSPPTMPKRPAFIWAAAAPAADIACMRCNASSRISFASSRISFCCAERPMFAMRCACFSICAGVWIWMPRSRLS